jgi:hypothetical protein
MPSSRRALKVPSYPAGLREAWQRRKLVLFLGAGVSQPYGLPSWNDLVLTLLLDESSRAFDRFWPHYRVPLGSWLAETFGVSAVSMARLARIYARRNNLNDKQFRCYVRDQLYRFQTKPTGRSTLAAVVDLIAQSEQDKQGWHIPIVVSFNYDDLLERQLRRRRIEFHTVFSNVRRTEDILAILHVHGYLPSEGDVPEEEIVFTEDEYHRLSFVSFHWSQVDLVNLLRNYTVLFVGLSMTDPNLRRLLDASHTPNSKPSHYLLKKEYSLTAEERTRAYTAIDEKAQHQASKFRMEGMEKSFNALEQAVNEMLRQAHEYDTDLLQEMGVETLWLKDFDQIASFVHGIGRRIRNSRTRRS